MPLFYSTGQFAKLTGIPASTIRDYCKAGVITSYRPTGGHRIIPAEAVEELKANQTAAKPQKQRARRASGNIKIVPPYKRGTA